MNLFIITFLIYFLVLMKKKPEFIVTSEYSPAGDQSTAIKGDCYQECKDAYHHYDS